MEDLFYSELVNQTIYKEIQLQNREGTHCNKVAESVKTKIKTQTRCVLYIIYNQNQNLQGMLQPGQFHAILWTPQERFLNTEMDIREQKRVRTFLNKKDVQLYFGGELYTEEYLKKFQANKKALKLPRKNKPN